MKRSRCGGHTPGPRALLLLVLMMLQGAGLPCAAQGDTRASPIDPAAAQSPLPDASRERSIDLLLKQGTNARRQGNLDMAITLFSAAHQLAPDRYDVHLMLADTLRWTGRAGEAARHYDEAIAVDPTRAEAYIGRALLLWDQFNYTSALTIGTQALERVAEDGHAVMLANTAETQRRRGRITEATGLFEKAIEEAPDLALAHAGLGHLAEEKGDLEGALRQWDEYIRLSPKDGAARLRREELLDLRAALLALDEAIAKAPRPDLLVEAGRLRAVAGDASGAATAYRRALELDPVRVDARRGLALALLRMRDHGGAMLEFRRVLERWPDDAVSLYNLVALAAGAQNDGVQEQAWIDLLTARPGDLFAAWGFAQFLRRVDGEALRRAIGHFDGRASHENGLLRAILRATAGRWEETTELLREALLADPSDPRTVQAVTEILNLHPPILQDLAARVGIDAGEHATVAELLVMARLKGLGGDWGGTLDLARRAVEADLGSGAARSLLAEARLKANGDLEGALHALKRAVIVEPRRLVAHVDLALALLRSGQADLAAQAARAGLERIPGAAELQAILGGALVESGDLEGAAEAYAASLRADPADSLGLSRGQLPLVLAALGRNVEARHALAGEIAPIPGLLYLEAWMFVRDSNIDPDFNGQDWLAWRDRYLGELFTTEDAYQAISTMLSSLGDPYTRLRGTDETAALYLTRHGQGAAVDQVGRKRAHGQTVVVGDLADGRGYIQLNNLTDPLAVEELRRALAKLGDRDEIILDLRGNRGGLTRSADAIGDLFVGPGVEAGVDEEGGKRTRRVTGGDGALTGGAVTVLVDDQTASAAERLALTLEETGRGRIVGETTHGKGRYQASRVLPGGVTVLVSKGQTLDRQGRPVQNRGLRPRRAREGEAQGSVDTGGERRKGGVE